MTEVQETAELLAEAHIKLVTPKSRLDTEAEAVITHYLYTRNEIYREEAITYSRQILENKYPKSKFEEEEIAEALDDNGLFELNTPPFHPVERPLFTFIDLFAGIGGFRMAFQNLGGGCIFSSEWNSYAKRTYSANYGEVPFGDITQVNADAIPDHDILVGGFPCQPFSIAGVSKKNALGRAHGFMDKTQGTLFFDIVRILRAKRPRAFLLENVKNLVSHDRGNTFRVIQGALRELEYNIYFKVLDGKYFVPQHRERIVIVGFDERVFHGNEQFSFPEMPPASHTIASILEEEVLPKYTLSNKLWNYLQEYAAKHKKKGNGFGYGLTKPDGISRTISARYYKDGAEILIPQKDRNPRRLTPRECARLQGYPDTFQIPVSDTQAYKQFGNSVVMPLMQAVGAKIVEALNAYQNA